MGKQEQEPVWGVDVSFSHIGLEAPVGASGKDVQWAVSKYGCGASATCKLGLHPCPFLLSSYPLPTGSYGVVDSQE